MQKTSELIWQDTQHQALFRLIDMIQEEPFERGVLIELQRYAEHHFVLEEAYMQILVYPDMQAHIQAHDRFRDEIEWLKRHVFGLDKTFEAFVMNADVK